ncbi:MAG TPA: peptide ABC transporter substrate-binding protein [Ktedonobacteraceae bacterium]|nr:peptide ABC transporter substrate-binding protein [Ktedonobacteraceae bacterium]
MRSQWKFRIKFLSSFLCLTIMLFLAACGTGGSNSQTNKPAKASANQQVFNDPLTTPDISTFDPAQATDLNSIGSVDMVFTGLVQENDQLQVQGQLAQSYAASPDGLTWTFHLKPNLTFSDGTALTSTDVAYSIDRALSPQISSLNGISLTYLGLIQGASERVNGKVSTIIGTGIQAPDPTTVVIHVVKNTAYFLQALTYPTAYVVEKSVITRWGLKWTDHLSDNGGQGGDGPFKVLSYSHTTGIVFVPNPHYYGPHPQLQKVNFSFVKDENTNYLEYQAGQADLTGIPSADEQPAQKLTNQYHQVPQLWIEYYSLNYLVKPFDNIHIREALDLAINKDVLVQGIYHGLNTPTNHIVPKGMPGYNQNLTGPDGVAGTKGDEGKAKALFTQGLKEEGLTLATFPNIKFTYSNSSASNADEITTVIQIWQRVLGITTIQPDPVDGPKLFSEIFNTTNKATLQLWKVDWIADYPDPQNWLTLQFASGEADNNMNYGQNHSSDAVQQQTLQAQMIQADSMSNQTARMQTYNQIEQQLVNDVAWLPIYQVNASYLLKPYVIGFVNNSQDLTPPDDWGNVYIAKH